MWTLQTKLWKITAFSVGITILNYLKRQYRIRHWIPMFIGTLCIKIQIRKSLQPDGVHILNFRLFDITKFIDLKSDSFPKNYFSVCIKNCYYIVSSPMYLGSHQIYKIFNIIAEIKVFLFRNSFFSSLILQLEDSINRPNVRVFERSNNRRSFK